MKSLKLIAAAAAVAVAIAASANAQSPQYRTSWSTNFSKTVMTNEHVAASVIVFTPETGAVVNQLTLQNYGTNKVQYILYAPASFTNATTNACSSGLALAPAGTVGDRVTYNVVIPDKLRIAAEVATVDAPGTLRIEALGRK